MLYFGFPLSLPNLEDMLHERGIVISHERFDTGGITDSRLPVYRVLAVS